MPKTKFFVLIGVSLAICGFGILLMTSVPTLAQGDEREAPDYIGADECSSCHRDISRAHNDSAHALTLQEGDDGIIADFSVDEEVRMVTFPGEDTPRAFTQDDVAYSIGTGRFAQRYLYEVDRNEFRVFPAEWDVTAGEWRALDYGETWDAPGYDWELNCAGCHTTGFNPERGRWEDDGAQCESCHGPGEAHQEVASDAGRNPDEEELIEIRATINNALDPQTCGQCHSRGIGADNTAFPIGYLPGDDLASVFTLPTIDQTDHWWSSGHARLMNMQYNEWVISGHALSLVNLLQSDAAQSGEVEPKCLTCHSADYARNQQIIAQFAAGEREGTAPEPITLETAQYGVTCSSCHNPHIENGLPNHMVAENDQLCVSCHSDAAMQAAGFGNIHHPAQEMFEGTPVIDQVIPEPGVHFVIENGPTCATCHAAVVPVEGSASRVSHAPQPVTPATVLTDPQLQDSCTECHGDEAPPALMQELIDDIQSNTRSRIDTARAAITDTTPEWVSRALDFVEGDGSLGIHNYAYSDAVLDAVYTELGLFPPQGS